MRVLARAPSLDPAAIDDVIVGCAIPEAEQGMNVARIGLLLAGLPSSVAGMTVNRFCSSGLNAVSIAADRIRTGEADLMIAAGTESMSMIPTVGRASMSPEVFARDENLGIAYGMGLTAERVAERWKVSREDQDAFALESHRRALAAQAAGDVRRGDRADRRARAPAGRGERAGAGRARRRSRATRGRARTRPRRRSRSCGPCSPRRGR